MIQAERRSHSLRALLLWMLIPAQILVLGTALWFSSQQLRVQIDHAYDRSLLGALKAIDHNISTASGGLAVELPYLMLQFFELSSNHAVYYRILTEDGLADVGNQQLPLPHEALGTNVPALYDAEYLGVPVRIAAMARDMDPPLYGRTAGRVIVMVGEDRAGRDAVIHTRMLRSILRDVIELLAAMGLIVLGVLIGLRPLTRLYRDLKNRPAADLSPITAPDLPREIQPLVNAVNQHMARHARMAQRQRQFLNDASHQLRTPLAVLRTQLDYALRETDPTEARTALVAMQQGLIRAQRTAAQLLALARAQESEDDETPPKALDLTPLVQDVIRQLYSLARQKRQTLDLEGGTLNPVVLGSDWLIREALSNLVENAIKYTPEGGSITLTLASSAEGIHVRVQDSGPGMPPDDIRKAGKRFRRGQAGKREQGAGLGLAIVQTIMQAHHGRLVITSNARGCCAALEFPPVQR